MSQIPDGAEGTVAGVMVYCVICLLASCTMIWLSWTHDERTSYVAMLSYFATLSITASLVQQVHDVVRYRSLVTEQFENRKAHPNNPEVAIANGSTGFSLVLYYIQYYCYNVEAMCVMFWAAYLAQSVYGLSTRSRWKTILRRINRGGKIFAVLFPLTTILLLRIPQIQKHFVLFILMADLPLMLSLLFSCILLIMILARYVNSRRKFLHWTDHNNSGSNSATLSGGHGKSTSTSSHHHPSSGRRNKGMWDRWLLVRFTIAAVCLSIFEVTNTLFQIRAVTNAEDDAASATPDFSADRAKGAWIFFMPGVTPGLFIFVVFGTTKPLRRYMYETIVPKRWQKKDEERNAISGGLAVAVTTTISSRSEAAGVPPPVPPKDNPVTVLELQNYTTYESSSSLGGKTTSRELGEEGPSRGDSDEFPILPGKNRTPRY